LEGALKVAHARLLLLPLKKMQWAVAATALEVTGAVPNFDILDTDSMRRKRFHVNAPLAGRCVGLVSEFSFLKDLQMTRSRGRDDKEVIGEGIILSSCFANT
jgi:hypothetical protein